ncbi:MAG: penicillin acylase family protein [Gammaproteobacteria bacterium]
MEIERDFWGIPYIKGKTNVDVAYGIGRVHAQDAYKDLTELMPLYRGELAKKEGISGIGSDYLIRLLRVWDSLEEKIHDLDPVIIAMAEAYADGVNDEAFKSRPREHKSIGPIDAKDVIAGSFIQHMFFAGLQKELALMNDINNNVPTGSNAVAVNYPLTKKNESYLMINSHQPLSGPVGWYELNVASKEGWLAHGGNFPGSFLINVGVNKNMGWGATVNRPDVVDIFKLTINPNNQDQYLVDGKWETFRIEEDFIEFKIWILPVRITQKFKYSKFGPVIPGSDGKIYAIRHSSMGHYKETLGWMSLNLSQSVLEFSAQIQKRLIPSFNFVTLDSNNNIGYFYNGRIPERFAPDKARSIQSGEDSKLIWEESAIIAELPTFINPPNGWVQSTNQDPFEVSGNYSRNQRLNFPKLDLETRITNRSFRADEILETKQGMNFEEFVDLKFDNAYSKDSRQYKFLYSLKDRDEYLANLIKRWDLHTNFQNKEAYLVCLMSQEWRSEFNNTNLPSYELAANECMHFKSQEKHQGKQWSEINKIERNGKKHSIQGSVDTLRAVYGSFDENTGEYVMSGGDGLFFLIKQVDRQRTIYGMHNFGSSRNNESNHFSDQTYLFANEALRYIPLEL